MARRPMMRSIAFRGWTGRPISTGIAKRSDSSPLSDQARSESSRQRDHLRLHLEKGGATTTETTRKLILASGFAGSGGGYVPEVLTQNLPRICYAHTSERSISRRCAANRSPCWAAPRRRSMRPPLRWRRERGKCICLPAATLASLPVIRIRGYPGAYDNYGSLPDAVRWHQAIRFRRAGSTPPPDAISRAVQFPNFHLHLASPWTRSGAFGSAVRRRPRRAEKSPSTSRLPAPATRSIWIARRNCGVRRRDPALGRSVYAAGGRAGRGLAAYPYLGSGHEYLEKEPGRAPS